MTKEEIVKQMGGFVEFCEEYNKGIASAEREAGK